MNEGELTKGLITFTAAGLSLVVNTSKPFILAMLVFILIDYVTGLIKAMYLRDIDSKAATKGLIKKGLFILTAFTGWAIDIFFNIPFSVGTIITTWIIITEIISIFENLIECDVPIPRNIVKYFKRFKDNMDKEELNNESD